MTDRILAESLRATAAAIALLGATAFAQPEGLVPPEGWAADPPALDALIAFARDESEMRNPVIRYVEDEAAILRRYPVRYSPAQHDRLQRFYEGWAGQLEDVDFSELSHEARIDYILLRNEIAYDRHQLGLAQQRFAEIEALVPFADGIRELEETRLDRERVDPRGAASMLHDMAREVERLTEQVRSGEIAPAEGRRRGGVSPVVADRAAGFVDHLQETLANWNTFYDGYDPMFTWWMGTVYPDIDAALEDYALALREELVGLEEGEVPPIVGDPVLADGLAADLEHEMIAYTPEELIRIGEQEFAWIEERMIEVSRDMGYGDDWKQALEHTKNLAPPPGEVPWALYDIAHYSEDFIENMDAVTMAPLAREIWRFTMQTPERQLINPFFTGGEVTHLSYPTNTMEHDQKMMSMRGNTPHFNFPTVHHELVPGHHYQGFMDDRFNQHRAELIRTPFWGEGWALYWELVLWDEDFARNDPDRIGMLFWRMHRAARIIFSLNYQLGEWTPQEAVDFLVERVGHERANAEAEVRRTAQAAPLYQIGYLIGGLQIRALYDELVTNGDMSPRTFHDAILIGGRMPIEMVRARLTGQELSPDYEADWEFYDFE
ncbi:DUF885 family protein [Parvularcula oceani]|uniref:DUF885 family protein n=1 Tax=Parvularcula oceani TaxID=1247963 RepID=UPI00055CC7F6|nr:DUF885 family protein [Parvularcula oceani]